MTRLKCKLAYLLVQVANEIYAQYGLRVQIRQAGKAQWGVEA